MKKKRKIEGGNINLSQGLKWIADRIRNNISIFAVLIPVCIAIWHVYNIKSWKIPQRVICWDVVSYYAYLPATFIYHDPTLKFIEKKQPYPEILFWPNKTSDNKYVIKMSLGLSYLYAPFFFLAHATVGLTHQNPSGFSPHYKYFLLLSGILYYLIGLLVLRKILRMLFSEYLTAFVILTIALATNLFYYGSTEATMPHVYLFALTNIFILTTIRWYESPGYLKTILLGVLTGLISLIRPTNLIVLVFFFLWDIKTWKDLNVRFKTLMRYFHHFIIIGILIFIIWIPQFLYWKTATGHWVFFSYIGERFYFLHPQILNGLFSFRKGWLLYTPVMIFAVAGIPVLWHRRREFFWPVLILFVLHVYLIYSWWCWWYGGSLGSRPMIDIYGPLAVSMAFFLQWILERKKWIRFTLLTLFLMTGLKGGLLNIQYYYGTIHWEGMTSKAYFKSFFRIKYYPEIKYLIRVPDHKVGIKGEEKYFLNDRIEVNK
jgi:hypothetical protein